jgi:hypothetical protein
MFENHRLRLLRSLETAHAAYYRAAVFGGPSLHFHLRALAAGEAGDFDRFVEAVYAMLVAWGMHRMGRGGPKMVEFEKFQSSLGSVWPFVLDLRHVKPEELGDAGWRDLEQIFCRIRCMETETSLVGNSKVLAHALPRLIPPIDRRYTLGFLFGKPDIKNGLEAEWKRLQTILRDFFYPLVRSDELRSKTREWMCDRSTFRWDTSPLKVIDNLVIGLVISERFNVNSDD